MTDNTEAQPEALRLAERLDLYATGDEHQRDVEDSADELRRQHAEIQQLRPSYQRGRLRRMGNGSAATSICLTTPTPRTLIRPIVTAGMTAIGPPPPHMSGSRAPMNGITTAVSNRRRVFGMP